ncbi:MAG: S53 family peptidase [Streptosporangiaceae bacterium]|nr:S53 family peptidase [Streptosporangiaceae bacterium]
MTRLVVCGAVLGLLMAAAPVSALAGPAGNDCLAASPPGCYTPQQFRTAYDIQPLLDRGIDGRGKTVTVIVYAAGPVTSPPQVTDIRQDLATFDGLFHLSPAHISVVTTLADASSPWTASLEEVIDTEIVHAVAPGARLRVVLMPSTPQDTPANAVAGMLAALPLAIRDTDVVSFSGAVGEHFFSPAQVADMERILREAAARHVTVVAASGDSGAASDVYRWGVTPVKEVSLPASDPFVLSVGGTALTVGSQSGSYVGETAWNQVVRGGSFASGGGFSGIFARPAYQVGVPGTEATRGVPDVSGDASTGLALVRDAGGGTYELLSAGGTSAATPLWGGLMADADQLAGHDLGSVNPALYRIARDPRYGRAFHDVTTGNNTVVINGITYTGYQAGPGWDPVTGLGSPDAAVLVPILVGRS